MIWTGDYIKGVHDQVFICTTRMNELHNKLFDNTCVVLVQVQE